jgi:ribosome-associated toxin RatA of RatAB toxin-antitoxin module
VKLFHAKSFKKFEGEWQLRELELRNDVTDARTQIQFDLRAPRK